ncbi:MAG: hypothetical protein NZ556_08455 [Fimbriimonadales bacterium]|nr:hypothetical protein [Fimbriimonadales bacterium]
MKKPLENPLLYYQLLGYTRNRWKRQPLLYGAVAVAIGLTYLLVFQLVVVNAAQLSWTLNLCLSVMCLTAPLMAYNLFSLEYEKQTWESLALTRLTAKEILWGKWGAALARVGILTLFALPLLLTTLDLGLYPFESEVGRFFTLIEPSANLYVLVASLLLLFGWGALVVSVGMWLSLKLKRTLSTASALYAGQVFLLLLLPMLYFIFSQGGATRFEMMMQVQSVWDGFLWWVAALFRAHTVVDLNPFVVSFELDVLTLETTWRYSWGSQSQSYDYALYYLGWGIAQSAIYLALAGLFAGLTYNGLKFAWRK